MAYGVRAFQAVAVVVLLALLAVCVGTAKAQTTEESEQAQLSEAERAKVVEGARKIAGLDEEEITRVMEDPELIDDIPVSVKESSETIKAPSGNSSTGLRTQAATSEQCARKRATQQYVNADDEVVFEFTAIKSWCIDGTKVTRANMNEVETSIRPADRYAPETGGWRYAAWAESGTEEFQTYQGHVNGSHKSTRVGKFEYLFPGESEVAGNARMGFIQTAYYAGQCRSSSYAPTEVRINFGPSGVVGSTGARFGFSTSDDGAAFQCNIDGEGFVSCSSPVVYRGLPEGRHNFRVQATDSSGNAILRPPVHVWTVDTTAPYVASVTPVTGAQDVAAATNVKAVFSEDVDAVSLLGNFTLLEEDTGAPVEAALSYDPDINRATLNPDADLDPGETYTATVKGGDGGVTDRAGNPLATDKVWSFTVVP